MRLINRFFFILLLHLALPLHAQNNRALIVAVGTYPAESGWSRIHALNDLELIYPVLIEKGYLEKNISVLTDERGTKSAIIESLRYLATQSGEGDHIYIHFSCHGQQMVDDNSDEEDGLDEAIIPYDAQKRYEKGKYEGEKHLRDDELGAWLEKIRRKITKQGNITVVIDACHSATGTRYGEEDEYIRGTSYVFGPEDHAQLRLEEAKLKKSLDRDARLAPVHVFTACEADEKNYELKLNANQYYGLLSYAFSHLLRGSPDEPFSYAHFYNRLAEHVRFLLKGKKWTQTPTFESSNEDKEFKIAR